MGAIAGGAMGNAVGQGGGRAVATMVGLMGGAILGDRIEGNAYPQVQNVQRCTTQTYYENRAVAYNVVYEYAGQRYQTQMPNDPGPTIRLNVSPVGAGGAAPHYAAPMSYEEAPRFIQPAPVVLMPTVRLQYDNRVIRPPFPIMLAQGDRWDDHRFERRFDRRDERRDERRDAWQDNRHDNRDGRDWRNNGQ
jgi:hypothetical protein